MQFFTFGRLENLDVQNRDKSIWSITECLVDIQYWHLLEMRIHETQL